MAEYIEREALVEEITRSIDLYWNADGGGYKLAEDALEDVKNAPTADVVPKSEVEELKAIIVDHKANEERWQELYTDTVDKWEKAYEELEIKLENVRAEVAREIFEEIERLMENNEVYFRQTDEMQEEFAELKKKYTEEKE